MCQASGLGECFFVCETIELFQLFRLLARRFAHNHFCADAIRRALLGSTTFTLRTAAFLHNRYNMRDGVLVLQDASWHWHDCLLRVLLHLNLSLWFVFLLFDLARPSPSLWRSIICRSSYFCRGRLRVRTFGCSSRLLVGTSSVGKTVLWSIVAG